ncbi:MAG: cobalamin-binding protein [Proteobacteria bacterium]|nr:cobalamin-binding protein [Pseudomonadota bacterium]
MSLAAPRIISFLPSATEMACALGLGEQLVGVTHECDHPAEAKSKPVVVRNVLPIESMSQGEVDAAVAQRMRDGLSLYCVDEALVRRLEPDLILTQNLCEVCAPSGNELGELLRALAKRPEVLWMTPRNLAEIDDNLRELGRATGRVSEAEALVQTGAARLRALQQITGSLLERPRVFFMEWLDPVYCGGHWIPEMVAIAGGRDGLARPGGDSVRVSWREVLDWAPQVLIIAPCGLNADQAAEQARSLVERPGWFDLPAVRDGRVFAVNANSYFARPGPRVVDGAELLAHLLHPDHVAWGGGQDAYRLLPTVEAPETPAFNP